MPSAWLATTGFVAAALGVATALPQVWRLLRTPGADGMSLPSVVLGALGTGTWLTYGLLEADPPQIVANVPGLAGAAAIAVLVVRRTTTRPAHVLGAVATWCGLVAAAWAAGGAVAVGSAATVVSLVARAPQVREVFTAPSLAAISPLSFGLSTTACTLWAVYGVGTGQLPVWASSVVAGTMSLVVCVRATVRAPEPVVRPVPHPVPRQAQPQTTAEALPLAA
ncbi:SemiSWEET family transporter [Kineosporia sp. A_224]|uniref:SemiSWEET family transporter n=1 Tax=Kineosporia sp. A_224 TaxID=1962180 RepID=UPI0013041C62|nr:SemiSWEET family transporter [Kineosporia sp. A_224]